MSQLLGYRPRGPRAAFRYAPAVAVGAGLASVSLHVLEHAHRADPLSLVGDSLCGELVGAAETQRDGNVIALPDRATAAHLATGHVLPDANIAVLEAPCLDLPQSEQQASR